jgi:hypothetical protein
MFLTLHPDRFNQYELNDITQHRYKAGGMKRRNELKREGEVRTEQPVEKKRVFNTSKEMVERQTLLLKNR